MPMLIFRLGECGVELLNNYNCGFIYLSALSFVSRYIVIAY